MEILHSLGLVETQTPLPVLLFRLLLAAVLGAVIGLEREVHKNSAGLRTHILIATAAALFTISAFEMFHEVRGLEERPTADPIRSIEAVTAGVAFLGAGAIFRGHGSVQGLTTGAGMWMAGAVGMSCAIGHYILALFVAAMAVVVLAILLQISRRIGSDDAAEGEERR